MAIRQVVPISILLQGDGATGTFVFYLGDVYQISSGSAVDYGSLGVIPTGIEIPNPPAPLISATIDAGGNITITLVSPIPAGQILNFVLNLLFNSGDSTPFPIPFPITTTMVENFPATQPVSIVAPVAVTQSTSPWVVTDAAAEGYLATIAGAISAGKIAVSGTIAATQSGAWTVTATNTGTFAVQVTSGTVTTTPPLNATTNITLWNTVALGSPTAYGTAPSGNVIGVNAFVTNFPATQPVSIAAPVAVTGTFWQATQPVSGTFWQTTQPVSGIIAATQSGAWSVGITTLGQQLAAASVPVVLTAAQIAALTPLSTIAVSNFPASQAVTGTFWQATQPVSIATMPSTPVTGVFWQTTQPVSGTIAVSNFPVSQAVTGTFWQTTQPVSIATLPALTAGTAVIGHVIVDSAPTTAVTGTFWQATQPVSIASMPSTPVTGVFWQATQPVDGALTNNNAAPAATLQGVLGAIAETAYATVTYTTGDMVLPVTDLHGALNTDLQAIGGVAVVAATAGVQKVGIVGSAGTVFDGPITAAGAPANGLAVLHVYESTAPALTTGQSVAAQCDSAGSLFVKPLRRSQTVSKATTIITTGATSILAAQAAGTFADISSLIVSAADTTSRSPFTITLSDGTNSYIYDMDSNASAGCQFMNLVFNPPLPATSAATAWTLNLSVATTVHVTVIAILQKAS
jgi:hypothetical protein